MAGTGFLGRARRRGLPPRGRRPLPHRHLRGGARRLPRRRDPRPVRRARCATPAGRPATAARPGRTARTPAASSACTSSTRSRCSPTAGPRTPRPSTSGCSAWEQEMLAKIEVPYRVIDTAAGDLGGPAARKFDCEAWVPTQGKLPRADLDVELHDVPGAPAQHPLARPERLGHPRRRDAQRHAGHDPLARRDPREPPAGRRLGRRARRAAPVPRSGRPQAPRLTPPTAPPPAPTPIESAIRPDGLLFRSGFQGVRAGFRGCERGRR